MGGPGHRVFSSQPINGPALPDPLKVIVWEELPPLPSPVLPPVTARFSKNNPMQSSQSELGSSKRKANRASSDEVFRIFEDWRFPKPVQPGDLRLCRIRKGVLSLKRSLNTTAGPILQARVGLFSRSISALLP